MSFFTDYWKRIQGPIQEAVAGESLKAQVFRGGAWMGAGTFSEQVVRGFQQRGFLEARPCPGEHLQRGPLREPAGPWRHAAVEPEQVLPRDPAGALGGERQHFAEQLVQVVHVAHLELAGERGQLLGSRADA